MKISMHAVLVGLTCLSMPFSGNLLAQERSASGSQEVQASFGALKTMITNASNQAIAVDTRMNHIVACNKKWMIYNPPGVDADGCVPNTPLEELKTRVSGVEDRTTALEADMAILKPKVDLALSTAQGADTKATTALNQITTLTGLVNTMNTKLTDLGNRMTAAEANLKDLTSKYTALNQQVITINTTITSLQSQINDLSAKVSDIKVDVKDLQVRVKTLESTVTNLTTKVTNAIADINALEVDVASNTSDINKILYCGRQGKIYDSSANTTTGCVLATAPAVDFGDIVTRNFDVVSFNNTNCQYNTKSDATLNKFCTSQGFKGYSGVQFWEYSSPGDNCIATWDGSAWKTSQATFDSRPANKIVCFK